MTIIRGPDVGGQGGILGRAADGRGPDGVDWPANTPEYAAAKAKRYGWTEPNRRTNQMLSQTSLYGRTRIEPDQVTLVYGTDTTPVGSAAPSGYLSKSDKSITDTEKAKYAHEGQSAKRVKRGFYGFTEEDRTNVINVAQNSLNDLIRETNQRNGV